MRFNAWVSRSASLNETKIIDLGKRSEGQIARTKLFLIKFDK